MSLMSDNTDGHRGYRAANLGRECAECGASLSPGRPSVARGGSDYCLDCVRDRRWLAPGYRSRLVELGLPEPGPDGQRFD